MKKKCVDNKGRVSIMKYGKTSFEGDGFVTMQWDSPRVMVLGKLSITCWKYVIIYSFKGFSKVQEYTTCFFMIFNSFEIN